MALPNPSHHRNSMLLLQVLPRTRSPTPWARRMVHILRRSHTTVCLVCRCQRTSHKALPSAWLARMTTSCQAMTRITRCLVSASLLLLAPHREHQRLAAQALPRARRAHWTTVPLMRASRQPHVQLVYRRPEQLACRHHRLRACRDSRRRWLRRLSNTQLTTNTMRLDSTKLARTTDINMAVSHTGRKDQSIDRFRVVRSRTDSKTDRRMTSLCRNESRCRFVCWQTG